jgi:hypothetical protein
MVMLMLATACSTSGLNARMASWQGSHLDEISSAWGSPDECIERDGREFCSWTKSGTDKAIGIQSDTFRARPMCTRTIEIDESGVITGWRWRGDRCSGTASEVLTRVSPTRPEQLATSDKQSPVLELAVIQPAAQPAITRTQ